jgi:hypothetical protein
MDFWEQLEALRSQVAAGGSPRSITTALGTIPVEVGEEWIILDLLETPVPDHVRFGSRHILVQKLK